MKTITLPSKLPVPIDEVCPGHVLEPGEAVRAIGPTGHGTSIDSVFRVNRADTGDGPTGTVYTTLTLTAIGEYTESWEVT